MPQLQSEWISLANTSVQWAWAISIIPSQILHCPACIGMPEYPYTIFWVTDRKMLVLAFYALFVIPSLRDTLVWRFVTWLVLTPHSHFTSMFNSATHSTYAAAAFISDHQKSVGVAGVSDIEMGMNRSWTTWTKVRELWTQGLKKFTWTEVMNFMGRSYYCLQ